MADKGDALASFECHQAGLAAECERREKQQLLKPGATISHISKIKPLKLEQTDHECYVLCVRTIPSLLI